MFDPAQDGNLFPREDLLEAVAQSDWRDRAVPMLAWVVLALGAAALFAGLPLERVVYWPETEAAAALEGLDWLHSPALFLAKVLGQSAGIGIETALFLIGALGTGVAFAAVGLALRAFGFRGRLNFACALTVLFAPIIATMGRLPSLATLELAASALLLVACAAPFDAGQRGARGFVFRVGVAFVLAALTSRTLSLLAIPASIALATRLDHGRRKNLVFGLPFLALGLAVSVCAAYGLGQGLPVSTKAARGVASSWMIFSAPGRAVTGLEPWLGTGLLAIAWPLSSLRAPEELGAPRWLHVWVALGLVAGIIDVGTSNVALPALAVFLANALARRARPDGAQRLVLAFVFGQLLLSVFATSRLHSTSSAFTGSDHGARTGDHICSDELGVYSHFLHTDYLLRRRVGTTVGPLERPPSTELQRVLWASTKPLPQWASARIDLRTGEVRGPLR